MAGALSLSSAPGAVMVTYSQSTASSQLSLSSDAPSIAQTFLYAIMPPAGELDLVQILCDPLTTILSGGVFSDAILLQVPPQPVAFAAGPMPYGEFYQRAGDIINYGIVWAGWLANYWESGSQTALGIAVRPRSANGYQYVVSTAGTTAAVEPLWPAYLGAQVLDGSTVWTCEPLDETSLEASIDQVSWNAPTGIAIGGKILAG